MTTITIREALPADKEQVISFCSNTFDWGDYIDQVWDIWYNKSRQGRTEGKTKVSKQSLRNQSLLLVAEESKTRKDLRPIAISNVTLCPDSRSIWLEGLRVHPDFRRLKVATALINRMLEYGKSLGATEAYAIVAEDNRPSRQMMERNGFAAISRWTYYSVEPREVIAKVDRPDRAARHADKKDLRKIWLYLQHSEVFKLSAAKYVRAWHWYPLDLHTLKTLVASRQVLITGDPITGVALINRRGYWNRRNIFQITYLDCISKKSAIRFLLHAVKSCKLYGLERLQILCYKNRAVNLAMMELNIQESEKFILYSSKIA